MRKFLFPLIFIYCCDLIIDPEENKTINKESDISVTIVDYSPDYTYPNSEFSCTILIENPGEIDIDVVINDLYDNNDNSYASEEIIKTVNKNDSLSYVHELTMPTESLNLFYNQIYCIGASYDYDNNTDNNTDCIYLKAHIEKRIFFDNFNASNQTLSSYSSFWEYTSDHYSTISVSDNRLVLQGVNDGFAHRIWDKVLIDTKLIDKVEFNVDMGFVNYSYDSDQALYGIFIRDGKDEKVYHLFLIPKENNQLTAELQYNDGNTDEWVSLDHQTLSTSSYDLENINFKLIYENYKLKSYLDNSEIFSYGIVGFECKGYGIYTQNNYAIWVDNVAIYGKETSLSREKHIQSVVPRQQITSQPNMHSF